MTPRRPIQELGSRFDGSWRWLRRVERTAKKAITVVDAQVHSVAGADNAGHRGTLIVFSDGSTRFVARSRWRRLAGWILCHWFGDHQWTTKAKRGIPPSPAEITDGMAGFDRYRTMYCERCPKVYAS